MSKYNTRIIYIDLEDRKGETCCSRGQ